MAATRTKKRLARDTDPLIELFLSLDERRRPEDIARLVRKLIGDDLNRQQRNVLNSAARGALKLNLWGFSSMSSDFARPVGLQQQMEVARQLFQTRPVPDDDECKDPECIEGYLVRAEAEIGMVVGQSDFMHDRLNRDARKSIGLDISKRQYNKRFRLAARMERKRLKLMRELQKRSFTLVGKSRLASEIPDDEFATDINSACFIAYYTARCNLRSEYTISGQQKPYDQIADMLFERCRKSDTTNWFAIAHVFPERETLSHLTDEQKGRLLGRWYGMLQDLADFLKDVWETSRFDFRTMIVRRGDDSSTWNATAGAWNKARDSWFALLAAMDMHSVIDELCPGKVLRLMAADVAAWHRRSGGGLDPDTSVWAELPRPWEVLTGASRCTREMVENLCERHCVEPVRKGWTTSHGKRKVQKFRPTPELVHGVTVGHPGLALVLRQQGWFSGKQK